MLELVKVYIFSCKLIMIVLVNHFLPVFLYYVHTAATILFGVKFGKSRQCLSLCTFSAKTLFCRFVLLFYHVFACTTLKKSQNAQKF